MFIESVDLSNIKIKEIFKFIRLNACMSDSVNTHFISINTYWGWSGISTKSDGLYNNSKIIGEANKS